jgi:hypothetical protein
MVATLQISSHTTSAMTAFRTLLISMCLALLGYTAVVISQQGLGLLAVFISNLQQLDWSGQFNLDFSFMLMLSALWVMWRHQFSGVGVLLGLTALVGGILFLSSYLIIQSFRLDGKVVPLLIGSERVASRNAVKGA